MEAAGLSVHGVRKSSQWMTLLRSHATAIAADTKLAPVFEQHCMHYSKSVSDWYVVNGHDTSPLRVTDGHGFALRVKTHT